MAATRRDISEWFDNGVQDGATHLIVVCDDFDFEDYPVYVSPGQSVVEESDRIKGSSMQRIMEVYALHLDKESQLGEFRAFHYETLPAMVVEEDPI